MYIRTKTRSALIISFTAVLTLSLNSDYSSGSCPCASGQWCLYEAPVSDECGISTIPDECECVNGYCPETHWYSPHPNALTAKLVENLPCPPWPGPCDGCNPTGYCFVNMRNPCLWHYPCVSDLGYICNGTHPCFHDDPEEVSIPGWWKTIIPCCVDTE